ncbi:MAG: hypothetical protein GX814_01345 [Microbacteriaceae bacterium]|nr:hypothetical protein [Microbacteriaceae bacterium]
MTAGKTLAQQRRIALMTGVGVFAVLAVSLLLGSLILQFFGIGVESHLIELHRIGSLIAERSINICCR